MLLFVEAEAFSVCFAVCQRSSTAISPWLHGLVTFVTSAPGDPATLINGGVFTSESWSSYWWNPRSDLEAWVTWVSWGLVKMGPGTQVEEDYDCSWKMRWYVCGFVFYLRPQVQDLEILMSNLCNQHNMEGSVGRHPAEEGATSLMPCLHGFKLLFEEFTKGSPFDMWKHGVHIAKRRFLVHKCANIDFGVQCSSAVHWNFFFHDYTSSSIGSKVLKLTGILKDVFDLASPTQRCISFVAQDLAVLVLRVRDFTAFCRLMNQLQGSNESCGHWQCQLIVGFFLIPGSQDFFCRWCNFGVPAAVETC